MKYTTILCGMCFAILGLAYARKCPGGFTDTKRNLDDCLKMQKSEPKIDCSILQAEFDQSPDGVYGFDNFKQSLTIDRNSKMVLKNYFFR